MQSGGFSFSATDIVEASEVGLDKLGHDLLVCSSIRGCIMCVKTSAAERAVFDVEMVGDAAHVRQ